MKPDNLETVGQTTTECREQAQTAFERDKPVNWIAAGVVVAVWVCLAALVIMLIWKIDR